MGLTPQTWAAVYDGHGGSVAAAFLQRALHVAVGAQLSALGEELAAAAREDDVLSSTGQSKCALEAVVRSALCAAFAGVDSVFICRRAAEPRDPYPFGKPLSW